MKDKNDKGEELSTIAVGYAWCVRISTFSMEFAILAALGVFFDRRLGTAPWGAMVGVAVGVYVFASGLIAVVKRLEEDEKRQKNESTKENAVENDREIKNDGGK